MEQSAIRGNIREWSDTGGILLQAERSSSRSRLRIVVRPHLSSTSAYCARLFVWLETNVLLRSMPSWSCRITCVRDWPYSSFHRYVRQGLLTQDWAGTEGEGDVGFGERKG